jgi:hypothetical protein
MLRATVVQDTYYIYVYVYTVITSQWSGMWGQEWDIETSFRLRIMDHLPISLSSLWGVLFLTIGTHEHSEICLYPYVTSMSYQKILWEPPIQPDVKQLIWPKREMSGRNTNPRERCLGRTTNPAWRETLIQPERETLIKTKSELRENRKFQAKNL